MLEHELNMNHASPQTHVHSGAQLICRSLSLFKSTVAYRGKLSLRLWVCILLARHLYFSVL